MFLQRKSKNRIIVSLPFRICYAKTAQDNTPGITVVDHLINVAQVCHVLCQYFPKRLVSLGKIAVFAAALHDVRKVSPGFQLKYFRQAVESHLPEFKTRSIDGFCTDHSQTGGCALWQFFDQNAHEPPLFAWVAAVHHGGIREKISPTDTGTVYGGPLWSKEREMLIQEMTSNYPVPSPMNLSPWERDFIAGMVTLADWIGSDETFFPPDQSLGRKGATQAAQNALKACGLTQPKIRPGLSFQELFGFPPYDTQDTFAKAVTGHGIYVLEAPMGMGKTEAALYAAYTLISKGEANGFFFGLPTRLTSDRVFQRVQDFLNRISVGNHTPKLVHGTAWLSEYLIGGEDLAPGNAWFTPRKRALLHPFVVGTIDQALMAVLRIKHHFVRTFALAGKVIILDEVHSYDGYTGTFLDTLTQALSDLGATVIILSATLTAQRRAAFFTETTPKEIPNYPLITGPDTSIAAPPPPSTILEVSFHDLDSAGVADIAVTTAQTGQCVLCIANTVAQAQGWHDKIQASMNQGNFQIGLLHSKFPVFQRSEIEDLWMNRLGKKGERPKGCILIATQVVEQSVDIDADFLITELAPTDMLLQRMGRLWRHARPYRPCKTPKTWIIVPDLTPARDTEALYELLGLANAKVYSPWVLYRTWQVWRNKSTIQLPAHIRELLESTYKPLDSQASPMEIQLYDEFQVMGKKLSQTAKSRISTTEHMAQAEDKEDFPTRYSDLPTCQVLLVRSLDNDIGSSADLTLADGSQIHVDQWTHNRDIAVKIHSNLLTIASYLVNRFWKKEDKFEFLNKYIYGPCPVMEWDVGTGTIRIQGRRTDFKYSSHKGLFRKETSADDTRRTYQSDWDTPGLPVFDKARFDW